MCFFKNFFKSLLTLFDRIFFINFNNSIIIYTLFCVYFMYAVKVFFYRNKLIRIRKGAIHMNSELRAV